MLRVALYVVFSGLLVSDSALHRAFAEEVAAPQQDEPAGKEMVWDGYLFRDEDGSVHLGWPVIAMGVMAQPAHVVEGPVSTRLGPLLTDVDDTYVFWNYELERRADGALDGIPRALVRLRGRVTLERPKDENFGSYHGGTRTMHDARLISVEFLDEAWLRQWGRVFRDRDSPFRIDMDRGEIQDAELQAFAKKLLPILAAMREVPASGAAEKRKARAIDPGACIVDTHRRQSERTLQRWLVRMKTKHAGLALEGLADLPPLPPSSVELQRLFLESETKAAFLAALRKTWTGDLESIELPYYRVEDRSTLWTEVDLVTIARHWSEEKYKTMRATTVRMVGR